MPPSVASRRALHLSVRLPAVLARSVPWLASATLFDSASLPLVRLARFVHSVTDDEHVLVVCDEPRLLRCTSCGRCERMSQSRAECVTRRTNTERRDSVGNVQGVKQLPG